LLESAERRLRHSGVVAVDPDGSGLDGLGEGEGRVDVLGQHTGRQTVMSGVGSLDHFLHGGELENLLDGAEDFLLGDAHVVRHISEDGRLDEIAFRAPLFASALEGGAFLDARLDQIHHLLELLVAHLQSISKQKMACSSAAVG
jgi:hypothetical protein